MKVSMSTVWDRTSEFLSEHFAKVAGVAALTVFVPTVITEVLAPLGTSGGMNIKLGLGILSLVLGIVTLWGQLTIVAMALDGTDPAQSRARATRWLPAAILVIVAILLAAFVLVLPIIFTLYANGIDPTQLNQTGALQTITPGASGFIALYVLILIPLSFWLVARFAILTTPVVVAEDKSLGAFGRAFRLSRGLTWRIIGVILLYAIVMGIASLAAGTVLGSLFAFLFQSTSPISTATVLTALVTALVATIFTVIGTVYPAKLYLAARAREDAATA